MSAEPESIDGCRLSSQQCDVHLSRLPGGVPTIVALFEGPADHVHPEGLRRTLERMCEQHEILRTRYREIAGLRDPLQYVVPDLLPAWTIVAAPASDAALVQAARSRIDPQQGAVVAAALAAPVSDRLRWALAAPSYSLDANTIQELALACISACNVARGAAPDSGDILQYLDYAAWQAELLASDLGREGARFWEAQAALASAPLMLPFEGETGTRAHSCGTVALSPAATAAVLQLMERLQLSAETVFLALWSGFVARITEAEILPFAWHCQARAEELRTSLGCFVTKLPMGLRLNTESDVDTLVRSVAESVQTAASWQECFDAAAVAGKTGPHVEFACARLHQLQDGWACRSVEHSTDRVHLLCECIDANGSYLLRWRSSTGYDAQAIETCMAQFATLLESLSGQAGVQWSRLPMLGDAERTRILNACEPQHHAWENVPARLHELFERQAQLHPHSLAVVCGADRLTYRQLDVWSNRLARRLQTHGAGPEVVVGIHLGRSVHAIAAMVAVLKAGAAYVPLDPTYPQERIDAMLADANVSTVIVSGADRSRFAEAEFDLVDIEESDETSPEAGAALTIAPGNLAYLIYTSGSTGRPKGVMVSHANAVASTLSRFDFYSDPVSSFLLLSSFSFDSSVAGIFWTLGQGGTLHIPPDHSYKDAVRLAALIAREKISHILALPSFYKQILDGLDDGTHLRCAVVAGEACHADVVEKHRRRVPNAALVNEYGPTEGTVWSNAFRIETVPGKQYARIPIGRPIATMRGYVLDDRLELCPIGVTGEWCIGGDGITRGYRGQPALTAQRFIADPLGSGERLYRTGDRVRFRLDGEIEYLGRADSQVKLRGFRIELGEIEQALLAQERVREAVAVVHETPELGQRLLAFVVADGTDDQAGEAEWGETLKLHLQSRLPAFMVPSQIIQVPRFPMMPNGKVDRPALLAMGAPKRRARHVAPSTDIERTLADIWQAVLKTERVGLEDDFFDLGGHSLLMVKLAARIREALGTDIALGAIFDFPTVRALAAYLQDHHARTGANSQEASSAPSRAPWVHVIRRGAVTDRVPLFCFPGIFVNPSEYQPIWSVLDGERELHGFVCHTLSESRWQSMSLETLVSGYARHVQEVSGGRPVALLGWSVGGDLAFETARQLRDQVDVRFVGLLDVCHPSAVLMRVDARDPGIDESHESWEEWTRESAMQAQWRSLLARIDADEKILAAAHVRAQHGRLPADGPSIGSQEYRTWAAINYAAMMRRYQWRPCNVSTHVWMADGTLALPQMKLRDWSELSDVRQVRIVEHSDHRTLLSRSEVARELGDILRRIDAVE